MPCAQAHTSPRNTGPSPVPHSPVRTGNAAAGQLPLHRARHEKKPRMRDAGRPVRAVPGRWWGCLCPVVTRRLVGVGGTSSGNTEAGTSMGASPHHPAPPLHSVPSVILDPWQELNKTCWSQTPKPWSLDGFTHKTPPHPPSNHPSSETPQLRFSDDINN